MPIRILPSSSFIYFPQSILPLMSPIETMGGPTATTQSPYFPMFDTFRNELDEHHDRRERIIKASRDITALSKKMQALRSIIY